MAPLPVNSTLRVWMDYTSGGLSHSLLMRFPGTVAPDTGIQDRLTAISNAVFTIMADIDAIVGWRYSLPSAIISLPFDGPTGNGVASGGSTQPEARACFVGVSARSAGGRRYHANFFTIAANDFTVYREDTAGLPGGFPDLLDAFRGIGVDVGTDLIGIDGQELFWKDYMNIGQNAYWQRAQR